MQNKNLPIILGVVIVALLGFNIYLWVSKSQTVKEKTQQLDESETIRAELRQEYDETLAELDAISGDNDELNALVDEQREELERAKDRIDQLARSEKLSRRELTEAKNLLASLRKQRDDFQVQIQTLETENAQLTAEKVSLTAEKEELQTVVQEKEEVNQALTVEKESLTEENQSLAEKVAIGSVLKAQQISVEAIRTRGNGKQVVVKAARRTEKLKVCFWIPENKVTNPGVKTVYLRLVNPRGETVAIESLGSGTLTKAENGESIRYTTSEQIQYYNAEQEVCMLWDQNEQSFDKGIYIAEVYNQGYLVGQKEFTLK